MHTLSITAAIRPGEVMLCPSSYLKSAAGPIHLVHAMIK